jgi:hypothetical protein
MRPVRTADNLTTFTCRDDITHLRNVGNYLPVSTGYKGLAVAQLGEALRYSPGGLGVDPR